MLFEKYLNIPGKNNIKNLRGHLVNTIFIKSMGFIFLNVQPYIVPTTAMMK